MLAFDVLAEGKQTYNSVYNEQMSPRQNYIQIPE
jgi:hypothetical protein